MADLTIIDSDGKRSTVELDRERRYVVGRSDGADIVLRDPALSRLHAELYFESGHWMVSDCESLNGTFVDGKRLDSPVRLDRAESVRLGRHSLRLRRDAKQRISFEDTPIQSDRTVILQAGDASFARATTGADELTAIRRRFAAVERANLYLAAHEPLEVLLGKIVDLVVDSVKPECVALLRRDEDGGLTCRARNGEGERELTISRSICNKVADERISVLTADARKDDRFTRGNSIELHGIRSVMAVPLWNGEEVIGVIYADSRFGARKFDEDDLKLLTMLGNVAAIRIHNAVLFEEHLEKRRIDRELGRAADIQRRLLPAGSPAMPGYDYLGFNAPCEAVGGDYFDWVDLGRGRYAIALGDVAGKGIDAALLMAAVQAAFHVRAETEADPGTLVRKLNDSLVASSPTNRFSTFFYMELDTTAHRVRCVNAGHAPAPSVVRRSGEVEELGSGGPPLGIIPGIEYSVAEFSLEPGDLIFVCSDGVTDVVDTALRPFGEERLTETLRSFAGSSPEEVWHALDDRLSAHAAGQPAPDDRTVVAVQRRPDQRQAD